jgi:hypothetical protein
MAITAASKPETYMAIHDVAWLQQRHDWPGLRGVVMVESTREIDGKIERETRFYFTSLVWLAAQLGPVRQPPPTSPPSSTWPIPHPKGARQGLPPLKRKTVAWDDDFLASLVAA